MNVTGTPFIPCFQNEHIGLTLLYPYLVNTFLATIRYQTTNNRKKFIFLHKSLFRDHLVPTYTYQLKDY